MDLDHLQAGSDDAIVPAVLTSGGDASVGDASDVLDAGRAGAPAGDAGYPSLPCGTSQRALVTIDAATDVSALRDGDCDGVVDACVVAGECSAESLVLHYLFEGNVRDATPHGNDALPAENERYEAGVVGRAIALDASRSVWVERASSLEFSASLTVELWVKLASLPAPGARAGLLDDDGRYGLFAMPDGRLSCTAALTTIQGGRMVVGRWTHLACVYDGSSVSIWQDGRRQTQGAAQGELAAPGRSPIALGGNAPEGDRLDGSLDSLRVWSVARGELDLRRSAGTRSEAAQDFQGSWDDASPASSGQRRVPLPKG